MCELLARAFRTNQHRGRAEIRKAWLAELGTDGLIALSGAMDGEIGQALLLDNAAQAEQAAREWSQLFPGPLLPRGAARRTAARAGVRERGVHARRAHAAAGGGHAPASVPRRGRLQGA
jgi:hypothetical protein